jgi:hypothetical protein
MKKAAVVFSAAAALFVAAVSTPNPAEARGGRGAGPVVRGLVAGGLASSAYGYGPGYGYYRPGYGSYGYDGYGSYGYDGYGYGAYGSGSYGYGAYYGEPIYNGAPGYYGYRRAY